MNRAITGSDSGSWNRVTVIFMDDKAMEQANHRVFRRARTTDVITQAYEPVPGDPDGKTGEILVNAERALIEGPTRGHWPAAKELALYIAHGCDHLTGGLDDDTDGRKRMRRRELRWLRDAQAMDLW